MTVPADPAATNTATRAASRLLLRVALYLCWAAFVVAAIPFIPLAIAIEWIERRLYGDAKTCAVLHD